MHNLLILLTFIIYSGDLLASTGKATLVLGPVKYYTEKSKEAQKLKRGTVIKQSYTIESQKGGQAQIKMSDGSIINIRPQSRVEISKFQYKKSKKDTMVVKLVRGSLRSVTGIIAKKNPSKVKVNTPVATMGVRGTDFTIAHCDDACVKEGGTPGTQVGVARGSVELGNDKGAVLVKVNKFAGVNKTSQAPTAQEQADPQLGFSEPKLVTKNGTAVFASISEEMVSQALKLHPDKSAKILREATRAGLNPNEIMNAAEANNIPPDQYVPAMLDSGAQTDQVIDSLFSRNPPTLKETLSRSMSTSGGKYRDQVAKSMKEQGMESQDVDAAAAVSKILTPMSAKLKSLQDNQDNQDGDTDSNNDADLGLSSDGNELEGEEGSGVSNTDGDGETVTIDEGMIPIDEPGVPISGS